MQSIHEQGHVVSVLAGSLLAKKWQWISRPIFMTSFTQHHHHYYYHHSVNPIEVLAVTRRKRSEYYRATLKQMLKKEVSFEKI